MPPTCRPSTPRLRAAATAVVIAIGACGGGAGVGERCDSVSECADSLQCLNHICVPRCARHSDCGDGYQCQDDGVCERVESSIGESCFSEVDCGPGQACHLLDEDLDGDGYLTARCEDEVSGGVLDDTCTADAQCRHGTCVLGRCVDICKPEDGLDCPDTHRCTTIPRELEPSGIASFYGCLPARGTITYSVPIAAEYDAFYLPVPGSAVSVAMIAEVNDASHFVGAARVDSPSGVELYTLPQTRDQYFANQLRHQPAPGVATLLIPQNNLAQLEQGAYRIEIGSYLDATGTPGNEIPSVEVVYKLDGSVHLDAHFYFLDLDDHPCELARLDAATAQTSLPFQSEYLEQLKVIFNVAGVAFNQEGARYSDIRDRPDLDGLDASRLGDLLALSEDEDVVNVFFVRTIAPAGLQALVGGPPGPPGRPGTKASGVVIAMDTLCYRPDWRHLARITAHEIARWMGLHRSVEPDGFVDAIDDSDFESTNLMYFSENGGITLSPTQKRILRLNPVLR